MKQTEPGASLPKLTYIFDASFIIIYLGQCAQFCELYKIVFTFEGQTMVDIEWSIFKS
jgi:hypothetical protein